MTDETTQSSDIARIAIDAQQQQSSDKVLMEGIPRESLIIFPAVLAED